MKKFIFTLMSVLMVFIITHAQTATMTIEEKKAFDDERSVKQFQPHTNQMNPSRATNTVLDEGFENGVPPAGWTVVNNQPNGPFWTTIAGSGESGNFCGSGEAATCSSDIWGQAEFDTELRTPLLPAQGTNFFLSYDVNYQNFANSDFLNLDISIDGGSSWVTILSWNEDHGSFRGLQGVFVSLNLDPYLVGANNFMIRWHYFDPNTMDWDWYAQIDNVLIINEDEPEPEPIPIQPWAIAIGIFLILMAGIMKYKKIL